MRDEDSSLPPDPLSAEKAELRKLARATRNAISPEQRRADADRVAQGGLPVSLEASHAIGGHYPTVREFDCLPLLARLSSEGHTVALPAVDGDAPLIFRRWSAGEPLVKGPMNIMEPASGDIISPSVLLLPLLAFDARGYRLGYGGGHYDRTLEMLRREGEVIAIGLAFDEQEVAQLPTGPHDQRLDWIVTPSRRLRFGEGI